MLLVVGQKLGTIKVLLTFSVKSLSNERFQGT
jgi:hypothetical protein